MKNTIDALKNHTTTDDASKSYATTLADMIQLSKVVDAQTLTYIEKLRYKTMYALRYYCWLRTDDVKNLKWKNIKGPVEERICGY